MDCLGGQLSVDRAFLLVFNRGNNDIVESRNVPLELFFHEKQFYNTDGIEKENQKFIYDPVYTTSGKEQTRQEL
jgi:hypothetical protein